MTNQEVLARAKEILADAGGTSENKNFLHWGAEAAQAAKALSSKQRAKLGFDFLSWARSFRQLYDNFDQLVAADPMILYEPANQASLEFHSSRAYIRYFRAGNRTSKTQSGYAEHYFVTTGQSPYRPYPRPPRSTFIVAGLPFTTYAPGIFEKKLLTGEDGNPLSPMFPVGGKWFYHYDERQHCITIACEECAEIGKGPSCPHPKSSIRLFSNENGWEVLQGAVYQLGHFDEHVDESFFAEARQRLKTVEHGSLVVTGTPLHGFEAWEHRLLTSTWEKGPPENLKDSEDPNSPPLVSLHEVSMWDAGIVPHSEIRMEMKLLDEFEIESRINGKPAPLAEHPVFDRMVLRDLAKAAVDPARGILTTSISELRDLAASDQVRFTKQTMGELRVWSMPKPGEVYIVGCDTASGLKSRTDKKEGDASCASVLRCYEQNGGIALELVAQWHGWKTPRDYADELMKLCVFYNSALAIVELTGGLGLAVVQRLKDDHCYWNMYREASDKAAVKYRPDPRLGVDTNVATKPFMIASLKQMLQERRLALYDMATIGELTAFEQQDTGPGGARLSQPRFQGAGGSKDDRVMSLAIATSASLTYAPLLAEVVYNIQDKTRAKVEVSKDMRSIYRELDRSKESQL